MAHIFHGKVNGRSVAGKDRGFYYYHVGLYMFSNEVYSQAYSYFRRVDSDSHYYLNALYYLGILNLLRGKYSNSEHQFKKVLSRLSRKLKKKKKRYFTLREMTHLNLARLYYETNKFRKAIKHYSKIEKDSDNWLTAIFEASWAFFRMGKHNNTLGNIHTVISPFFENRFYPESYVLQSITFLYLCFFNESKTALLNFKAKYNPIYKELKRIQADYRGRPLQLYNLVRRYKREKRTEYRKANQVIDQLSRINHFKETYQLEKQVRDEMELVRDMPRRFRRSRLYDKIKTGLKGWKLASMQRSGKSLLAELKYYKAYLEDLSDQGQFITLQLMEGKLDILNRSMVREKQKEYKQEVWGEGMKSLRLKSVHEYWPFEGEYWEDELGGYVYNVASKCNQSRKK